MVKCIIPGVNGGLLGARYPCMGGVRFVYERTYERVGFQRCIAISRLRSPLDLTNDMEWTLFKALHLTRLYTIHLLSTHVFSF
jgi:hypothetical protein